MVAKIILALVVIGLPLGAHIPRQILTPSGVAVEKWSTSGQPIEWRLNLSQGTNVTGTGSLADSVRAAFLTWSGVSDRQPSFSEGPSTTATDAALDGINLVSVSSTAFNSTALSLTVIYSFDAPGTDSQGRNIEFPGQILEADILLNPATLFSTNVVPEADRLDLQAQVTHEIGHLLGLGHSGLLSAVMFPTQAPGRSEGRTLGSDDVIGISTLYPASTLGGLGGVFGTVVDGGGDPVYGAHVVIVDADGEPVVGGVTNPDGSYQVEGLAPGSYEAFAEPFDGPFRDNDISFLDSVVPGQSRQSDFTSRFATPAGSPAALTLTKVAGDTQVGAIGTALATPLEVEVRDAGNSPVSGATVRFRATSGGGNIVPLFATSDGGGRVRATAYLGPGATQLFEARVSDRTVSFGASAAGPTLNSVSPSVSASGTSLNVTLTGTNFQSGATAVEVDGTGVAVSNVRVLGPTSLTLTLTVDANTADGNRNVTVTTPSGSSNTQPFTVDNPATISTISVLDPVSNQATSEVLVNVGSTVQTVLQVLDSDGQIRTDTGLSFVSLSPEVATVDASGVVNGVQAGFSTLTVTSGDVVAVATITVVEVTTGLAESVSSMVSDRSQQLYIATPADNTVKLAGDLSEAATVYAGISGTGGFRNDLRSNALFENPSFLALNQADGQLYVSDPANHRIRVVVPGSDGAVQTVAGSGTASGVDGPSSTATFNNPNGIALDPTGHLWVADTSNSVIRRINLNTQTVETIAGFAGNTGSVDGSGSAARFNNPIGIAIEPESPTAELERFFNGAAPPPIRVIVTDTGNGLLRRVDETGLVETIQSIDTSALSVQSISVEGEISPAGRSLSALSVAFSSPTGVVVDPRGNIYVTEANRVLMVLPGGRVVPVAQSGTFNQPQALAIGAGGNLLVGDADGASQIRFGEPVITSISSGGVSPSGGSTVTITGRNFAPDTLVLLRGQSSISLVVEDSRTLTLTTPPLPSGRTTLTVSNRGGIAQSFIDVIPPTLDSLLPGQVTTIAGGSDFVGDGGLASNAGLFRPAAIAVDAVGNLFIADSGQFRIRRVGAATQTITTVVGTGDEGPLGDAGLAVLAELAPTGSVAVDRNGDLYIGEANSIRRVDASTGIVDLFAGTGVPGFSGDTGDAITAQFNGIRGIAFGPEGDLFVADFANHRIRKIDTSGVVSTVGGTNSEGFSGDGQSATVAQLNRPSDVAVDRAGNVYIADLGNNRIRRISADGIMSTVAGNGQRPSIALEQSAGIGDGGAAVSAPLSFPSSVAVDTEGNIFIATLTRDSSTGLYGRIRRVDATTMNISSIAGNGDLFVAGSGIPSPGDGEIALDTVLNPVRDIVADGAGGVFLVDLLNNKVRRVTPSGLITTAAGTGEAGFSGTGGPATSATLFDPRAIAVNQSAPLFIAEEGRGRVQQVGGPGNQITRVAGVGQTGDPFEVTFSGDGDSAVDAQIGFPRSLAIDPSTGVIFFVVGENSDDDVGTRIRAVDGGLIFSLDDAQFASRLQDIQGIAAINDEIYFSNVGGSVAEILMVDFAGNLNTVVSSGVVGPLAIAGGHLYYAFSENGGGNHRIERVPLSGGPAETVAGGGMGSGDNRPAIEVSLRGVTQIFVDPGGDLYFFEQFNALLRRVDASTGSITTVQPLADDVLDNVRWRRRWVNGLTVDGAGNIFVTMDGRVRAIRGSGNIDSGFTTSPPPTLTSATPNSGTTNTSPQVTLTGTNFISGRTVVTLSSSSATVGSAVTVTGTNSATVTLNLGDTPGTFGISVSTGGVPSGSVNFTINAPPPPPPTLTSVTPNAGTTNTSSQVTLTGANFVSGQTVVTLSNSLVTVGSTVTVTGTTSATVTLNLGGSTGTVGILVSTAGGTSGSIDFTITAPPPPPPTLTSVTPNSGPANTNPQVTLTGTNFIAGQTTISVSPALATLGSTVTVTGTTSATIPLNLGNTTGTFGLTASTAGGTSGSVNFSISAPPPQPPTLTSVSPNSGPTNTNPNVTLTGTNFVPGQTTVNLSSALATLGSTVTVTGTTGATVGLNLGGSTGTFAITVSTSGGTSGTVNFTIASSTRPPASPGDLVITEIMSNPARVSDSSGEWFEIHNPTSNDIELSGVDVIGSNDGFRIESSLIIPSHGFLVLGNSGNFSNNGGVGVDFVYSGFDLTNSGGAIEFRVGSVTIDRVVYDRNLFPNTSGRALSLDQSFVTDAVANDNGSNWCDAINVLPGSDFGSPGALNPACP